MSSSTLHLHLPTPLLIHQKDKPSPSDRSDEFPFSDLTLSPSSAKDEKYFDSISPSWSSSSSDIPISLTVIPSLHSSLSSTLSHISPLPPLHLFHFSSSLPLASHDVIVTTLAVYLLGVFLLPKGMKLAFRVYNTMLRSVPLLFPLLTTLSFSMSLFLSFATLLWNVILSIFSFSMLYLISSLIFTIYTKNGNPFHPNVLHNSDSHLHSLSSFTSSAHGIHSHSDGNGNVEGDGPKNISFPPLSLWDLTCDPSNSLHSHPLIFLMYILYLSKIFELFDTLLIILRMKSLPFIHYYHHGVTIVFSAFQLCAHTCVTWISLTMNLVVHVILYAYFAYKEWKWMGWRWKMGRGFYEKEREKQKEKINNNNQNQNHSVKLSVNSMNALPPIPWKRFLTFLQVSQFYIALIPSTLVLISRIFYEFSPSSPYASSCSGTWSATVVGLGLLMSYLVLFQRLYTNKYEGGVKGKGKGKGREIEMMKGEFISENNKNDNSNALNGVKMNKEKKGKNNQITHSPILLHSSSFHYHPLLFNEYTIWGQDDESMVNKYKESEQYGKFLDWQGEADKEIDKRMKKKERDGKGKTKDKSMEMAEISGLDDEEDEDDRRKREEEKKKEMEIRRRFKEKK